MLLVKGVRPRTAKNPSPASLACCRKRRSAPSPAGGEGKDSSPSPPAGEGGGASPPGEGFLCIRSTNSFTRLLLLVVVSFNFRNCGRSTAACSSLSGAHC